MKAFAYWSRAISHAWANTRNALGHNPRKSAVGIAATLLAVGMFGLLEGGAQAIAKVEWWLMCLGGAMAIFLVVFGYHLAKAPAELEREQASHGAALQKAVESRLASTEAVLAEERAGHRKQLEDERACQEKDRGDLQSQIASLRSEHARQLAAPPIMATRLEVSRWIESAKKLLSKVETCGPPADLKPGQTYSIPSELQTEIGLWTAAFFNFVSEHAPSFLERLLNSDGLPPRDPPPLASQGEQFAQERHQLATFVDRLQELLHKIEG